MPKEKKKRKIKEYHLSSSSTVYTYIDISGIIHQLQKTKKKKNQEQPPEEKERERKGGKKREKVPSVLTLEPRRGTER